MKKIAVIQDLSGLGKCSLTAAIPVISVMGVQAVPLPTAVLSNQTGYPSYYCDNYTEHMEQIMDEWEKRGFSPDGIYTGFLADEEQADKILDFLRRFRKEKTMVLVDPVMGDNGSAYGIYTEGLREKMLQLVGKAAKLKYRSICLPLGLARLAAPYYERRSLRERKPLFFTPYSVSVLASNGQFSHAAASECFAYQPRPMEETLGDMTAWLLNQK